MVILLHDSACAGRRALFRKEQRQFQRPANMKAMKYAHARPSIALSLVVSMPLVP